MSAAISGCVNARLVLLVVPVAAEADRSMNTSLLEGLAVLDGDLATAKIASGRHRSREGSGASIVLATSVQYRVERASSGRVVKPIWLLTTTWIVPPVV
jgi:hypothetical protein